MFVNATQTVTNCPLRRCAQRAGVGKFYTKPPQNWLHKIRLSDSASITLAHKGDDRQGMADCGCGGENPPRPTLSYTMDDTHSPCPKKKPQDTKINKQMIFIVIFMKTIKTHPETT
ncbi:hypothetical protein [Aquaspirillum sp. LM1]|uniref:hypothetical protein n=1 Tax=Aquaspirillum sp. LM1 TaxID=1938604 RepID=UPI0012374371|nr:hypothetical protein [Aquaspirillum sp. LM1]